MSGVVLCCAMFSCDVPCCVVLCCVVLCCVVCVTWWIGYCVCVCVVHALYIVCNSFRSQI